MSRQDKDKYIEYGGSIGGTVVVIIGGIIYKKIIGNNLPPVVEPFVTAIVQQADPMVRDVAATVQRVRPTAQGMLNAGLSFLSSSTSNANSNDVVQDDQEYVNIETPKGSPESVRSLQKENKENNEWEVVNHPQEQEEEWEHVESKDFPPS